MLARLFTVRAHELRYIGLLGGFAFFHLAATTILGAASEALFINAEGAEQLPYGIILGQLFAIGGFSIYRLLRTKLRTKFLNPVVITLLAAGLATVYYFATQQSRPSLYLLIGLGPLYASVLASEYGRLSASVIDARSARRLLPLLGAIGGLGATAGAYLVRTLTEIFGTQALLLFSVGALLVIIIPAAGVRESMRPRVTASQASTKAVFSNRYAVALMFAATILIGISTLVRYQFGAAAEANYSGDELGVFYGNFYLALNIASIFFTLMIGRALVHFLGAARSLLIYPTAMLAALGTALVSPGLWATTATQFVERLFRQNIHSANSAIVGMPLPKGIRVQMALLLNGTIKPLAVVLTSAGILLSIGEIGPSSWTLHWSQITWPIALLATMLLGLMWFVRRRYAKELGQALQARRLQLDDTETANLPLDPQLRLVLHGYLASDLPERTALALDLLAHDPSSDTAAIVQRQWPLWEPWLKTQAVDLLLQQQSGASQNFLLNLDDSEPDSVTAKVLDACANQFIAQDLEALVASAKPKTRAIALALLANNSQPAIVQQADAILEQWIAQVVVEPSSTPPTATDTAISAAEAISYWQTSQHDQHAPELISKAPEPILRLMANRPHVDYAPLCIPYLGNASTYVAARTALQVIGEPCVPALEAAAINPLRPNASFEVLSSIEGHAAHLANMRLMAHPEQRVRYRATASRLHSHFDMSTAELSLASDNLAEALDRSERFHSYLQVDDTLLARVARSERNAALDDVFLNLALGDNNTTFRRAYLAQQSPDRLQRAFALELLDELLPRKVKTRLLPILEEAPAATPKDQTADRFWLELQQRLMDGQVQGVPFRDLINSSVFSNWRVGDLETLHQVDLRQDTVNLVLRNGQAAGLEQTLLSGKTEESRAGDALINLDAIYQVIQQQPRCGRLWLGHLAQRVPQVTAGDAEVTRSAMVSLASRTIAQDHDAANELALWQRMFFLRTCAFTQDLPPARLRLIASISRTLQAAEGETVVYEGRLGNHFYLVCSGRLEVSQAGKRLSQLGPSDGFGALSLMRGERRSLTVRATEPCELLAISRVDFLDLIDVHPSLVRSLARTLAAQILAAKAGDEPVG